MRWAGTSGSTRCRGAWSVWTSRTTRAATRWVARLVRGWTAQEERIPEVQDQGLGQQDDFAAIHEVITRYVTRRRDEGLPLPDLLIIDGGKGQLNAALDAMEKAGAPAVPMISLAKREEEVFMPGRAESVRLPRRSPSLRLLQRARDEAHRFGLAYNRKRRSTRTITSELLNIPGVGPDRRRQLLERFGSLAGVKSASVAELATVPGLSTRLAERIPGHLNSPT